MGEAWNFYPHSRSPHSSPTAQAARARASLRPPVFNPYDRFTQPEFDAWIGDITSALKGALSHDAEAEVDSPSLRSSSWNTIPDKNGGSLSAERRAQSPALSEGCNDESALEDSFAQIASRRAKGKARDPREGPGLGLKGQPIELSSDSEEEEVFDSLEAGAVHSEDSDSSVQEDSGGETDYTESELDEDEDASSAWPGTSTQHIVTLSSNENDGQDQEVVAPSDVEAHRTGYEDLQSPRHTEAFREDDGDGNASFAVLRKRGTSDEFSVQSAVDVELLDPWEGPRTFAEDYYSGGDRLAPGLTPNHITPLAGSPGPAVVLDFPTLSNVGAHENRLSPSPSVLSTSPSLKPHNVEDNDEIDELLQYGNTVATSVNNQEDIDEQVVGSYYDPVAAVDVTVHAAEHAEANMVESTESVKVITARITGEEISTSWPKSNLETKDRDADRMQEIISVPPSDDEHTDNDGEEDEGKFSGLLPLGTSDLDIRDDWRDSGRRKDIDNISEEHKLQEMVSSQTADDVAKAVTLTLSKVANPSTLSGPLMDTRAPILTSTFQLAETDSFGDLPVSSPPSETPSPTPGNPTEESGLRRHSIEQLLADFEGESSERQSQTPVSPGSLATQSEVETANVWPSQDIENILSGEISVPDDVVEVSGSTSSERGISQEADFAIHYPGYIVEEVKFEAPFLLPNDDFGDTRSIPSPDLVKVAETIQSYDVEEPKTDGRLTDEPEITIESSRNEDITVPRLVVSSVESTATPITSDQHVYPVPPTQWPSQRAPVSDASQAELSSTVPNIPAPIIADPSVPDPVPVDSSTHSPLITDTPDASGLSVIPPAILRVIDLDSSQISSGTSGLFTPAQRSEGDTPVQLEDDAAETPTALSNGEDKDLAIASIPSQPEDDPLPIERFITGYEDGGDAEDKDAYDIIEPSQLMPPNEHHEGIGTAGVGAQSPAIDAVESADEVSLLSGRGSTELSVSQLPKKVSSLASEVSSRIPPKGSAEHPTILDPGSERSLAGGDEDADGEADPDYSSANGAKNHHQTIAHQPDDEVTSNKIIEDTLSPKVATSGLESHPTSASALKREPEVVGVTSPGSPVDTSPALQDSSTAECGVVQGEGDFATSVQTRVLKRKRKDLNPGSVRQTRSESAVVVKRGKKKGPVSSSRRTTAASERVAPEWVDPNVDADSVDDGISETASASSGASTVYHLLHPTSRAGSVVSSASGDASWTSPPTSGLGRVIPLIHSHGLHRHGPAPPSPASSTDPDKGTRSEQVKVKSRPPSYEPSSPSLRRAPSMNSPVTRSNCRFHKISLPRGEGRERAYFVVPGCALGNGELMNGKDIRDEGFSTHEDHKRMLPNVETLDLDPYLVGVLRQLVGVDLLREQQEIFYLPSEEEKPKKRRETTTLGSLRQFRRQSISSGGPLGRDHSPRPSEVSQGRGTPRSASGSVVNGSVWEGSVVHSNDGDSILSDPDTDDDDGEGETPTTKRPRFSAAEINTSTFTDGDLDHPTASEHSTLLGEEPTISSKPTAPRRSKRKALKHDAAAYKPSEDDLKDDEEEEEKKKRRSGTRRAMKRSRTMEENSASAPRSKKKRLGRSVSVAGAGAMDS